MKNKALYCQCYVGSPNCMRRDKGKRCIDEFEQVYPPTYPMRPNLCLNKQAFSLCLRCKNNKDCKSLLKMVRQKDIKISACTDFKEK